MTSNEILAFAETQIGVVEKYDNDVIYNTNYYGHHVSGSQYPWCCVFIWYLFQYCGAPELFYDGRKTALCQTLADWFKQKSQWYTSNPQPGDIVFFKFGTNSRYTDHVGIVKNVKSNGTIETIEGNTSPSSQENGGMVMQRTRKTKIIGYGRPKYSSEPTQKHYLYKGIDVSAAQKHLSYEAIKKAGVEFAILKIIRKDLNKDEMFEKHYENFTKVGIPIFCVYNYSYATTVEKARSDAQMVINHLAGRRLCVCMDVEDDAQKKLGVTLIDIINTYQSVIESAGLPFILYTGMNFYKTYISPYENKLKCKDIWMARYYKSYTPMTFAEEPSANYKPMNNLVGWQYTSSGQISGNNGNLDFDVIYKDVASPAVSIINIDTRVKTNGSNLNVRDNPRTGNIVGKLPNGTKVTIKDVYDGWYVVDESKYVSPDYITTNTCGKVTAHALNIRDKDSTKGKILGQFHSGETVPILNQSSTGWYLTPKGWVSNNYIKIESCNS